MWEDSNLRCSPLWVAVLRTAAVATEPHMRGGAQLSRTVIPRGSLRVQAGSPHRWRYAPLNKLADGERVKRSSPLQERLASNEVGLSHARAIHGGTHCNRNRIPFEIASASNGAPAQPGLRSNEHEHLSVHLQLVESEGFDPPHPCYGRPSLSKRVQYQALPTLPKTWCVRPASNRQADGFEPSRYSYSRHSRMVGMERFELSRRSTGF